MRLTYSRYVLEGVKTSEKNLPVSFSDRPGLTNVIPEIFEAIFSECFY